MKVHHFSLRSLLYSWVTAVKVSWRIASGRWFPFRDVESWLIQLWAREMRPEGSEELTEFRDLAKEEWELRKGRRIRSRATQPNNPKDTDSLT